MNYMPKKSSLLLLAGTLLLCALALEALFRVLPTCEPFRTQPVNQEQPILHFMPDQDLQWSKGATFEMTNKVHVNNMGFVNRQDYVREDPRPLMAVIGDSYIEAMMVPQDKTCYARLEQLEPQWRFYSFGISGAPLSQYLAYAGYARKQFAPQKFLIVVVGNDFDESYLPYKDFPGMYFFTDDPHSPTGLKLVREDYHPGVLRDLARHSALVDYLFFNVGIGALKKVIHSSFASTGEYSGNTSVASNAERLNNSKHCVEAFLQMLPEYTGVEKDNCTFVMDGAREEIYDPDYWHGHKTFFHLMREYFIRRAQESGYPVIDMQPVFKQSYAKDGKHFESAHDGHWNPHAHDLVAREVAARVFHEK